MADSQAPLEEFADCSKQGYYPTYVSEGTGFGLGQASSPGLEKGLWSEYSDFPFWANTPATQKMNAALDKYYPGLRTNQQIFSLDLGKRLAGRSPYRRSGPRGES